MQLEYDKFEFIEKKKRHICDVRFLFVSRPDGEKIIKLIIEDKCVTACLDLIIEAVVFFR